MCIWYCILVLICWISFKLPMYEGPSRIFNITGENRFTDLVINKKMPNNRLDNFAFVVFYSPLSDKSTYVSLIILF